MANPEPAALDSIVALVEDHARRQLAAAVVERARRCQGCQRVHTVEELLAMDLRRTGCECGYVAPIGPVRSPQRFELGPDGWPKVVPR